ncbi:MAG TPA: nucleotide exchange factor GrpE [Candidatus Thalassarchaeaceae archaeon]|nr:nucleotide exchange factor GrpE [Euryarchaeota archaeon]DAC44170.1 MAG TPA: nucleotide exchange factor GrpE [Candidatus Poseidoniales archaeon]HII89864.1 nucleotide exchange factor GrpE [Candidatus Thalassarchaeaceae archaeon]|tara:strand:- start:3679 stop:4167 length:489 start_codon:yes stop_codon:yes gene_type:complete
MTDEDDITNDEENIPVMEEDAEASIESLERDLQYARAEIANIRSRASRERADLIRYSSSQLGLRMLDVLRSLELAIESSKDSADSTLEGVRLTAESMRSALSSEGIVEIAIEDGVFDPSRMEAIAAIPAPDDVDSGSVLQIIETGYMIHDRVLRPAKVVVSE